MNLADAVAGFEAVENGVREDGSAGHGRAKLFHVEQFGANGNALEIFVASGFVLWSLPLRNIMAICALLQRMGIFGGEREKSLGFCVRDFGASVGANPDSRSGFVICGAGHFRLLARQFSAGLQIWQSQATATAKAKAGPSLCSG